MRPAEPQPPRRDAGGAPHGDLLPCLPRGRRPSAAAAPGGAGAPRGAAPPGGEDRQDSDVLELEVLQGVSGERLCTVSAQGGWGVGDLKVAVEEKAGIAPGQQRLLVGNEPLSTKMPDLRATLRGKPPVVTLLVGPDPWPALEGALHDTIRGRVQELPESFSFPSLREMSLGVSSFFVAVPGMYGGFNVEREGGENDTDDHPVLQAESWSRVCAGSGQRHIIDAAGARLVAEGFV